mmetsp:Transcript_54877/g.116590  ORF Transcript_54877/g.116590 Transcript_54877/m.116590 type:complete len:195 (+) Transcript_54877:228-812(+)
MHGAFLGSLRYPKLEERKEHPGYSSKYQIDDLDAVEETRLVEEAMIEDAKDASSVELCKRLNDKLKSNTTSSAGAKVNTSKVTVEDVTKFNLELVDRQDSDACRLRKLVRHERLYNMMKDGPISKDKTIWFYLDHYGSDRHINFIGSLFLSVQPRSPLPFLLTEPSRAEMTRRTWRLLIGREARVLGHDVGLVL